MLVSTSTLATSWNIQLQVSPQLKRKVFNMSLKLHILMALLSCAAVKAQCPDGLAEGQAKCDSCFAYTACVGGAAETTECLDGTACAQDGDTNAVCVTPSTHDCVTCPASSLTACDPFDPSLVVACVPGQAPILFDTCDAGEICQDGACDEGTGSGGTPDEQCKADLEATGTDPAIITYKPSCTSGLLCSEGASVSIKDCEEDQYFDPMTSQCQSLPVNNCAGYGDAKAPSRTDCTKYVACKGGVEQVQYDCPSGQEFDTNQGQCLDIGEAECTVDLVGCTFESDGSGGSSETTSGSDETTTAGSGGSETTTSSSTTSSSTTKPEECTADNVNERYPVEGDCKSYWVCRKTSSDSYAYIEAECSGDLVYNPETTYCDLPENVPGCEE